MEEKKYGAIFNWLFLLILAVGTVLGIYYGFLYMPSGSAKAITKITDEKQKPPDDQKATSTISMKNTDVSQVENGKLSWEMNSGSVEAGRGKSERSVLGESSGSIFNDQGRMLTFFAPSTVYDPKSKTLKVQGKFTAKMEPDDLNISASNLQYGEKQKQITADDPSIEIKGATFRGNSLTIDTASKTVTIDGGVQIKIPMKGK